MSTKRKAVLAAASTATENTQTPPAKKRKFSSLEKETPETTSQTGYELLAQLKRSRDKQGWQIATHFLTLPDPKVLPEYYKEIGLPIALDTIENKVEHHEYPTISALESDFKRMISNAKAFNTKASQIYSDAEKVRKLLSNFMVERNPAYRDQTYQAVPTPLPPEWESKPGKPSTPREQQPNGEIKVEAPASELRSGRRSARNPAPTPTTEDETRRASSTPAVQEVEGAGESFEGNTFQQAQEKIVNEMLSLTDEDNRLISANFIHLPPRSLVDYYQIIKHPVSLKALQKQVRGAKGHAAPSGSTLLRSWNAFAEETSHIWNNAREYNEDGSEIVDLAEQLKEYFFARLKEARAAVQEPPQPRVKLTIGGKSPEPPPKITLKFGNKASNASGITVDNAALKRQQELVKAASSNRPTPPTHSTRPVPDKVPLVPESAAINGIKRETSGGRSPGIGPGQVNGLQNATMAPPAQTTSGIASGSPHPQHLAPNGVGPQSTYPSSAYTSFWRSAGKDASDALISNLNITTHPDPNRLQRFNLDIPASDKRTQQSVTITLPNRHAYLRIQPTLSTSLLQRPSKTIVTCNNRRQQPHAQRELDQIRPLYEHMLSPGVNTIEVEVIAGLARGAPKVGTGNDIEIEKITLFVHLQGA